MAAATPKPPAMTASERVVMLLSLVGFLRERNGISVAELATRFDVSEAEVRSLVGFLGTAGVPGDTMSYQHEDLFDIDWEALNDRDEVWLTQVVAVDDAPRFAPAETAALIAGLQALTPLLPEDDALVAEALSRKLGGGLGDSRAALSLQHAEADPRLPILVAALKDGTGVTFGYRDATGVATERVVSPLALTQHGEAWYLRGFCWTRKAERTFRVAQMTDLSVLPEIDSVMRQGVTAAAAGAVPEAATGYELIARIPAASLGAFAPFTPRVLAESAPGELRVAIDAWHGALALQLMRIAPGHVVIESPASARIAVHEWASRALAAYDE